MARSTIPSFGKQDNALGLIGLFHDFRFHLEQNVC